jgi:hypothetical protein
MLERLGPDRWRTLVDAAQKDVDRRSALYQQLAALSPAGGGKTASEKEAVQTAEVT